MDDIDGLQRRVRRYWYEDGLTEIAAGCLALLVGLLFFVEVIAPTLPDNFTAVALSILIIVGVWVANRVVATLKERLTYPRTGYVSYRRSKGARGIISGLVSAAIAVLAAGLLRAWPFLLGQVISLQGLIIGVFLLYLAHTLGLSRCYTLAVLSAVAGVATSLAGFDETLGMATYYCVMGAALVVSGLLTLRAYLRQTHPTMGA